MPRVVAEYKEKAKDRIAEAALEVFSKKGYHDATMDDIAGRLGVSKAALYQYFKSKEELYKAILAARFENFTKMLSSGLTGGSFAECCRSFLDNLIKDSSGLGLAFEIISESTRNPSLAKVSWENYNSTSTAIEECLEEWKKKGSLRKDFDPHLFAKGLVAFYDGVMVQLAIGTEPSEIRKIFAEFIEEMQRGILRQRQEVSR
jgi:AcrR family transcriptional regulator